MSMQIDVSAERSIFEAAIWRNRLLLAIVFVHIFGALCVSLYADTPFWSGTMLILPTVMKRLMMIVAINLVIWRFFYGMFYVRPKKPIHWLISDLRSFVLDPQKMVDGLICFFAIGIMATSFTFLKDMIPTLQPFTWDPQFAALDRMIHGTDPWKLLWPVFGNPYLTSLLNFAYGAWFIMLYIAVFAAAFDRRDPQRGMVYLVAFALSWMIGGNLFATLLSSAGPVYYEAFGFGTNFSGQMQMLHELAEISPIWALDLQKMLLDNYNGGGAVRGISAMPSMHVATSVVMTMFAFSYARWLGWLLVAFTVFIMIGSVHLGWHYASDGYVSVGLTLLIWWASKKLVERFGPLPSHEPEGFTGTA